ncbi:MAG TPA: CPBP family intramembrane glutamic endopeptidase [Herpetosiphonaceae bacterium]
MNQRLRERTSTPLIAFGLLAFGISWGVWIPLALAAQGLIGLPLSPTLLTLLGAFGPSLAAILLTATTEQWVGVRKLLGRLLIWRVGIHWYLFVLMWPAVLSLLTTAVHVVLGHAAPNFAHPPLLDLYPLPPNLGLIAWWVLVPLIVVQQLVVSSPMGEEIGWRGYALPRLQARTSPLGASIILGLIWSVWHLPLYLTRGHPLAGEFFGWLPLGLIPTTILFTWVFNHTRGSLLLALLFHAAINLTDLFLARTATLPLISPALTWVVALLVVGIGDRSGSQAERRIFVQP